MLDIIIIHLPIKGSLLHMLVVIAVLCVCVTLSMVVWALVDSIPEGEWRL